MAASVAFGPFRMDLARRALLRGGKRVPLTATEFELLMVLVQNAGRLLEKDELLGAVWPEAFVEENNLAVTVCGLRKALGEKKRDHRYLVTVPKRGYRFVGPVSGMPDSAAVPAAPPVVAPVESRSSLRVIAVAPLRMVGQDPMTAEVAARLADVLIVRLTSLPGVVVRSAAPVRAPGPASEDVTRFGRQLGVRAVVDGTVQRLGDRLCVTVKLVRVRDGTILWGTQLEERPDEIAALEKALADRVSQALLERSGGEGVPQPRGSDTASLPAYHAYLRGQYFWEKRTEESLTKAASCFAQAIRHDETYASAHVGLADCYFLLSYYGAIPPGEGFPKVKAAALRALERDGTLGTAHTSLGCVHLFYDWDAVRAEREFARALELAPDHARVHHWYSEYLRVTGRFEAAIESMRRAQELDPLSLMVNTSTALVFFYARRHDKAVEQLDRAIELDPHFAVAHWVLGLCYEQQGHHAEAIREFRHALRLSGRSTLMLGALGHGYATAGQVKKARAVLRDLKRLARRRYVSPYAIALVYAGLDERAQALKWLEKAYDERASWLAYIGVNPMLDGLRADPRFTDLVRRVGLSS